MRILVVGHEGYIGSGLVRALSPDNDVLGWGSADDVTRIDAEVVDQLAVDAIVNCSVAYDRASAVFTPGSPSDLVNVGGARALVEAVRGTGVRLVQISTKDVFGHVYGPDDVVDVGPRLQPRFLVDEGRPFAPRTAYAKSKLIAELIVEAHPLSAILRLSTCYTDSDHARGAWILRMVRAAVRGERITVEGSGKQVRDPLHVDDLARLIELVLAAPPERMGRLTCNVGGGPDNILSVAEVIELIDPAATIEHAPGGDLGFAFDGALAAGTFGWRPRVRLADRLAALRETVRTSRDG